MVSDMLKVNNKETSTRPMASSWCRDVNFGHISRLILVFLLLTLTCNSQLGRFIAFRQINHFTKTVRHHHYHHHRHQLSNKIAICTAVNMEQVPYIA